jgi:calcium and integrin-binding protein 1
MGMRTISLAYSSFNSCFARFQSLAPDVIEADRGARLNAEILYEFPELKHNPFKDRIFKVFSSTQDGNCNFEDFLDMMSVLSQNAPLAVKAEYAFRIFGMTYAPND